MKFSRLTMRKLEEMFIVNERGTFTPQYTFKKYDSENEEYAELEIIRTAEEVYEDWLENKEKVNEPSNSEKDTIAELVQQVDDLQSIILNLSMEVD